MDKHNLKCADTVEQDVVTVDAVHPRLLDKSKHTQDSTRSRETRDEAFPTYCLQCNVNIGGTVVALRNHFESYPHESQPCVYCRGPVYRYICRSEKNFHECILNAMRGRETDDASSLANDDGSDTSEMQSVSSTQNIESESYVNDTERIHDACNLDGIR
jgi:hypothetical protein